MHKFVAILVLLGALLLTVPGTVAEYPDMVGTWIDENGTVYLVGNEIQSNPAGINTWVITMQSDKVVSGYKTYLKDGNKTANETFVGIFDPDGKTMNIIDQPGGLTKGTLLDPDSLVVTLMDPGNNSAGTRVSMAVTLTLHRQSSTA